MGESCRLRTSALLPVFVSLAAQLPVCPPATLASVMFARAGSVPSGGVRLEPEVTHEAHTQRGGAGLARVGAGDGMRAAYVRRAQIPVHDPSGAIENVVNAVTSPGELLRVEALSGVGLRGADVIVAVAGLITMWSSAPGPTLSEAVPVLPASSPYGMRARRRRGAGGARARAVRRDRERRARGHVAERVVVLVDGPRAV